MLKQFIKVENTYGTLTITLLLVIIYMISFGFDSFKRYSNQEIMVIKGLRNQHSIKPPGKFNKTSKYGGT